MLFYSFIFILQYLFCRAVNMFGMAGFCGQLRLKLQGGRHRRPPCNFLTKKPLTLFLRLYFFSIRESHSLVFCIKEGDRKFVTFTKRQSIFQLFLTAEF